MSLASMVSSVVQYDRDCTLFTCTGDEDDERSCGIGSNPQLTLSAQKADLNVILATTRVQETILSCPGTSKLQPQSNVAPPSFALNRGATEEEKLFRLGKRKRESPQKPILFNPSQGSPNEWQMGESVDDFVKRLPPLTTSISNCSWIWVHNPFHDHRDKSASQRVEEFRSRGADILARSLQTRKQLQAKGLNGPNITRSLSQESKALQQRITDLAVECGVLTGKWMLFPKLENVTRVWKIVVQGVIDNRLGPTAKVAPDEGKSGDRLICIYTRDLRDEDDVRRVLSELDTMGLLTSGRSIYYKSDAFTYLDLYNQTSSEYGLQASLYTSAKMMATAKLSQKTSLPQKKQISLNSYF
ncbi:hypothetical protein GQ44DRAFT_705741 [Phaeosphaeriaceae sp. PMI808]|nr:hypothetical protein GQ44DRAFT_705741 [Phaeosphaeriaceae sp. PMI808]